jgi:anti-sigma factor RsiW
MTGRPDTPPDPLPEELFLRYWDGLLTDAEAAELVERLRTDPAARERFESLCQQVAALGECRLVGGRPLDATFVPGTIKRQTGG